MFFTAIQVVQKLVLFWFVLSVLNFSCSDIAVNGSYVSKTDEILIDHSKTIS